MVYAFVFGFVHRFTRCTFVILGIGQFSDIPNILEFPIEEGPEAFQGKVIYSIDYAVIDYESDPNFIKRKCMTVVGPQEYALDIAMECSVANDKYCYVVSNHLAKKKKKQPLLFYVLNSHMFYQFVLASIFSVGSSICIVVQDWMAECPQLPSMGSPFGLTSP